MKLLIVLPLVVFIVLAHSQYGPVDEEWAKYKVEYNKSYESPEDEAVHKKIFAAKLDAIIKHNRRFDEGKETYTKGLNQFSDLDPSDIPMGFDNPWKHIQLVSQE